MRRAALTIGLAACSAVLAAGFLVPDAFAVDRVYFKNGHVVEVREYRTEGKMAFLKLPDGSQMGIPAALIEKVEGDAEPLLQRGELTLNARGPSMSQLQGLRQLTRGASPQETSSTSPLRLSRGRDQGPKLTIGFVSEGSVDVTAALVQKQEAQTFRQSAFAPQRAAVTPWSESNAPAKPAASAPRAEFAVADGNQNQ